MDADEIPVFHPVGEGLGQKLLDLLPSESVDEELEKEIEGLGEEEKNDGLEPNFAKNKTLLGKVEQSEEADLPNPQLQHRQMVLHELGLVVEQHDYALVSSR